jgi:hypothetical protein
MESACPQGEKRGRSEEVMGKEIKRIRMRNTSFVTIN